MVELSEVPAPLKGARWDPLVRLTHWGIAAAVLLNGIVTEEGSSLHVWIGYSAFALLALRLVWGLIGTEEARFGAFPPSLSAARAHVEDLLAGRHREYRSHNPLGSLMVYALWGMLAIVAGTGIAMAGSPLKPRPVDTEHAIATEYGEHDEHGDDEEEGLLGEVHGAAANLLLALAAVHVAGVAFESRRARRNLVKAMVTGERAEGGTL